MPKLAYKEINPSGEKVVLMLHGLGANANSWQYQWPVLEKAGYRVIVPDFEGFGESPYRGGKINIQTMTQDIYEFLKELRIQKVSIVGLSMGGAVAQQFALSHPVITDKLVLANTSACFMARNGGFWFFMPRYFFFKLTPPIVRAKVIAKLLFPFPEQQEFRDEFIEEVLQSDSKAYMRSAISLVRFDVRDAVHRIKAPTLVIGGERDITTPIYLQEFLHEHIPNSRLVILEGGHVTAIDSATDFNEEMLDFLAQ